MAIQVTINNGRIEGYLTLYEFASKCKTSTVNVYEWIENGTIADYVKIEDRYWISENERNPIHVQAGRNLKEILTSEEVTEAMGQLLGMAVAIFGQKAKKIASMSEIDWLKYENRCLKRELELLSEKKP